MLAIELINVKIYVHLKLLVVNCYFLYLCIYVFFGFFAVDFIWRIKMNIY